VSALAGCLGDGGENADGYAAFFALYDWANQVGGDHMEFENPVESGEMGHGWSPDSDLAPDVASTDLFFYLDTPEFSWAQDLAETLETDYPDMTVVDTLDGLEGDLLSFEMDESTAPDTNAEYDTDTRIAEFQFYDVRSGERTAWWHDDHWDGGLPDVELDGEHHMELVVEDTDGQVLPLENDDIEVVPIVAGEDGIVDVEISGHEVTFEGLSEARTQLQFELLVDGTEIFDTEDDFLPIEVVEEVEGDGVGEFHDPHVWVDPVLVMDIVDTIAETLASHDEANADDYYDNAEAYKSEVKAVHEEFESVVADAELDTAVFAGHDSFNYVTTRYGFELVTPVGVSPDSAESLEDIANLVEVIEEHDIDTVLYDPFEAPDPDEDVPDMVELLFDETDIEHAEPLTPAEGTTNEWNEEGYGWVDQMTEINLPSLRKALKAE